MMHWYIVFINDEYVRDAQLFDTDGLSSDELGNKNAEEHEDRWRDFSPNCYVNYAKAKSEEAAVRKVAKQTHFDPRMLVAVETEIPVSSR